MAGATLLLILSNTSSTATVAPAATATVAAISQAETAQTATVTPSDRMEEVVVTGNLLRAPGSAHVLRQDELERAEYDDPHAVLSSVPGVYTRGEDGVGLRPNIGVRGVNPDRSKKVTLLEDGILFGPAPYSAPAAYYFPLMTRMTEVRVIKGPAAIGYGPQTVGGALDLKTRAISSTLSSALDLAGGQYGYLKGHGHFGWGDDNLGFLIEGVHVGANGFKDLPNDGETGFDRNEWMLKARYRFEPIGELENEVALKLGYSDEESNETYLGLADQDFEASPNRRYAVSKLDHMSWHRTAIALVHRLEIPLELTLETTAYRHDLSRSWRKVNGFRRASLFSVLTDPNSAFHAAYYAILTGQAESSGSDDALLIGPNERKFVAQGIESRLRWTGETGPLEHAFEAGVRLHNDSIRRRHTEDGYLVVGDELVPEGSPTITTAFNEGWSLAIAGHVLDELTWGPLTLTPGIRVEAIRSAYSDFIAGTERTGWSAAVLPGAGVFWDVYGGLGLLAGVHRGFSPPVPSSAERLDPELSINYEGGVRFARKAIRAEVIGYFNDYQNLTDICTLSSGCLDQELDRQFDAGKARIYGLEALAEYTLPIGPVRLGLSAAYTLTFTEFLSDFSSDDPIFGDVTSGDEIPYVPRHQGSAGIALDSEWAGASLHGTYVSGMREIAGSEPLSQTLATDPQYLLDGVAYARFFDRFEIYLNARNVLDHQSIVSRRPFGARPNAPRWIQVGLKVHLF